MGIEPELRLGASPGFHLPNLAGLVPGLQPTETEERRIEATYFDTADLRLARSGASLRHRGGEGWTLTLPEGELLHVPSDTPAPPVEALRLITAFRRSAPLLPVARLSTMRRRVRLCPKGAQREALTITDDEVSVLEGRRVAARFREVRLRFDRDLDPAAVAAVHARLAAAGAGDHAAVPVVVRALGPPAQRPPDVHVEALPSDPTVAEVLRFGLARSLESLLTNDPGARLGLDRDHLGRMQLAARRLRSYLSAWSPLLELEWASRLVGELDWLAAELGEMHDLELVGERLQARVDDLPPEDRGPALTLTAAPAVEVDAARRRLLGVLDSVRYAELLEDLVEATVDPRFTLDALEPAGRVVPLLAAAAWDRLQEAVAGVDSSPGEAQCQAIALRAEEARELAELASLSGAPTAPYRRALGRIEEVLREQRDSLVVQRWLRARRRGGRRGFAAGELYQLEVAVTDQAFKGLQRAWKAASRRSLRKWMQ